jgi:hypothetical protein
MSRNNADCAKEAIGLRPEPPRGPYVSDYQPVMPPVPEKCPRCKGHIITQYGDSRCLNCGFYLCPLPLPDAMETLKGGAKLPVISEVTR